MNKGFRTENRMGRWITRGAAMSADSYTTSVKSGVSYQSPADAGARVGACPEDLALVKQLLSGDEAAFASLVQRCHGRLIRLALVFVADRAVAEEVVQETWLVVLNGLRSFEGRSALKTWIFSILTNKARTRAGRERRSVPFSALTTRRPDDEPAVDRARFTSRGMWAVPPERWEEDTPEQLLLRDETRTMITNAIARLPQHQRAVVTLRDVEGLDSAEVCHILQINGTNQRVLLHRARSTLRSAMEKYLGDRRTLHVQSREPSSSLQQTATSTPASPTFVSPLTRRRPE